jgi:hypothetical protein
MLECKQMIKGLLAACWGASDVQRRTSECMISYASKVTSPRGTRGTTRG